MKWISKIGCRIQLGTILSLLISIISFGQGKYIAYWIATKLGYESCGCCERAEWLNKLTCKGFDGKCNQIKIK